MKPLEFASVEICSGLSELKIPYMVIGGLAAGAWGNPRGTVDVDVTINAEGMRPEDLVHRLEQKFKFPNRERTLDAIRSYGMIRLYASNGVSVDMVIAQYAYQYDALKRAIDINVGDIPIRFCSPEDLAVHKIISDRSQDQKDVRELLFRRIRELDLEYVRKRLKQICDEYDEPSPLHLWDNMIKEVEDTLGDTPSH